MVLVVGTGLTGCRRVTAPVSAQPRAEGRGKFEFVTPPAAPEARGVKMEAKELLTKDDYVAPRPLGKLAEPVYPATALAGSAGPVTMGVRLVVDTEGRVAEVSTSVLSFSTPTAWSGEFRAAIEAAVAQWRFRPAEVRHFTMVTNAQGTYRSMMGSEKTEWALHVAFTFNVSGGATVATRAAGAVKTRAAGAVK